MLTDEDFNRIHEDMAICLGHATNADVQALLEEVWELRRLVVQGSVDGDSRPGRTEDTK